MAMEKLKELMDEVKKFESDTDSEKLEAGMIGHKQLKNISKSVTIIGFIIVFVLWLKFSFSIALVALIIIALGERVYFFKSLMENKRIREKSKSKKRVKQPATAEMDTNYSATKNPKSNLNKRADSIPQISKIENKKENVTRKAIATHNTAAHLESETIPKRKEVSAQESAPKTMKKKSFDPSKVIIKE